MTTQLENIEVILLDIEGTTSPVSFVYETLFPYARGRLEEYLTKNIDLLSLKSHLDILVQEYAKDQSGGKPAFSPHSYLSFLMDHDIKSPALKSIQGKIWEDGFNAGSLKGELFPDVPPALERWRSAGYKTYIYSSGSVLAQKLLFQYSASGNLTCFLYGHFDTAVGAKTDPASYTTIAKKIYTDPANILFISDAPKELHAATAASFKVLFSNRPGNTFTNEGFPEISSFDQI